MYPVKDCILYTVHILSEDVWYERRITMRPLYKIILYLNVIFQFQLPELSFQREEVLFYSLFIFHATVTSIKTGIILSVEVIVSLSQIKILIR